MFHYCESKHNFLLMNGRDDTSANFRIFPHSFLFSIWLNACLLKFGRTLRVLALIPHCLTAYDKIFNFIWKRANTKNWNSKLFWKLMNLYTYKKPLTGYKIMQKGHGIDKNYTLKKNYTSIRFLLYSAQLCSTAIYAYISLLSISDIFSE